jgi:cyclase
MREVSEKVFVETGFPEGNVGLIKLREGVILVDVPPSPQEAEKWLQETEESILYIVVTDCHPMRLLGLLKAPFPKIAHYNLREELLGAKAYFKLIFRECYQKYWDGEALENFEPFLPTFAFKGEMTLHRGKDIVKLLSTPGPTSASIAVYLPKEKILFTGALVVRGVHPDLRLAFSARWIESLRRLKALPIEVLIPGKGEPCGPEAIDEMIDYLTKVRDLVKEFYQSGKGRTDVAKIVNNVLTFYSCPAEQEEEVRNLLRAGLARLYDEVKAENKGGA